MRVPEEMWIMAGTTRPERSRVPFNGQGAVLFACEWFASTQRQKATGPRASPSRQIAKPDFPIEGCKTRLWLAYVASVTQDEPSVCGVSRDSNDGKRTNKVEIVDTRQQMRN